MACGKYRHKAKYLCRKLQKAVTITCMSNYIVAVNHVQELNSCLSKKGKSISTTTKKSSQTAAPHCSNIRRKIRQTFMKRNQNSPQETVYSSPGKQSSPKEGYPKDFDKKVIKQWIRSSNHVITPNTPSFSHHRFNSTILAAEKFSTYTQINYDQPLTNSSLATMSSTHYMN